MKEEEGITLSPNHGLNPAIDRCMICGNGHGIVLFGQMENDEKAPQEVCTGRVCIECQDELKEKKERLYIEVDDVKPTGRYARLPDEVLTDEHLENIKDERILYLRIADFKRLFNESE